MILRSLFLLAALSGNAWAQNAPRYVFVTSSSGTAALQTWADSLPQGGLAAADAICRAHAAAGQLPEASSYRAWLSDSQNDMFCRVRNLGGHHFTLCGFESGNARGAGPWLRLDGKPFLDVSDNVFTPNVPFSTHALRAIAFDETGALLPVGTSAFTATRATGAAEFFSGNPADSCADWTSAVDGNYLEGGGAHGAGDSFSEGLQLARCGSTRHLVCLHAGTDGVELPSLPRPRSPRRAFTTSSVGTGNLATWDDANGAVGAAAGDEICRAAARDGGFADPSTYRALLSTSTQRAAERFAFDGAWHRNDGVLIARGFADLHDGVLDAPAMLDENAKPGERFVFTGTPADGGLPPLTQTCNDWGSQGIGTGAIMGVSTYSDAFWTQYDLVGAVTSCLNSLALYCFADHPYLFGGGFERNE